VHVACLRRYKERCVPCIHAQSFPQEVTPASEIFFVHQRLWGGKGTFRLERLPTWYTPRLPSSTTANTMSSCIANSEPLGGTAAVQMAMSWIGACGRKARSSRATAAGEENRVRVCVCVCVCVCERLRVLRLSDQQIGEKEARMRQGRWA